MAKRVVAAFLVVLLGLAGLAAACSGGGTPGAKINVAEKDYAITLGQPNAASGKFKFVVKNAGPNTHEFVIFKTDKLASELPVANNVVTEDAPGLAHIDEVEDIAPGKSKTLSVTLQPGHYAFICNLLAHYQQGMHVDFTVN